MSVVIAKNSDVYHLGGCQHERRISVKNKEVITLKEAQNRGLRKCRCCKQHCDHIDSYLGLINMIGYMTAFEFRYDKKTSTFFFRTDNGFWKAFRKGDGYKLFHRNVYDKDASFGRLTWGDFHRQKDVSSNCTLGRIVHYIDDHDKAMKIIDDDPKKLPQRTSKEKYYYNRAQSICRKRQDKRLDALLDQISGGKVNYQLSAW